MNTPTAFAIIALAGLIHASFQLSISMLTLLSGHAIGAKRSGARVLRLAGSFFVGTVSMTLLIVAFLSYLASSLFGEHIPLMAWAVVCGLMFGLGVAVWVFYYRQGRSSGTTLWLPRGMARFLTDRTKSTKLSAEAFGLGLASITAELLFIIAPASAAALSLAALPPSQQLLGVALYTIVASLSLATVYVLIGSGHKLSAIQRWREQNKRFLQFAAGSALIVLGAYIYVNEVVTSTVVALGDKL